LGSLDERKSLDTENTMRLQSKHHLDVKKVHHFRLTCSTPLKDRWDGEGIFAMGGCLLWGTSETLDLRTGEERMPRWRVATERFEFEARHSPRR
jgi:hypothetical protein